MDKTGAILFITILFSIALLVNTARYFNALDKINSKYKRDKHD